MWQSSRALLPHQKNKAYTVDGCKNCKKCLKIGCPAIIPQENSVMVDNTLCNGCGLCASICPFNSFHVEENQ